jgi:hypothetical protein
LLLIAGLSEPGPTQAPASDFRLDARSQVQVVSDGDDGTPCGRRSGRARLSGAFVWSPPNTGPGSRQKRP